MVIRDTNIQVRVLYIGDPGPNQDQIGVAISSQSDFQLVKTMHNMEKMVKEVEQQAEEAEKCPSQWKAASPG